MLNPPACLPYASRHAALFATEAAARDYCDILRNTMPNADTVIYPHRDAHRVLAVTASATWWVPD